MKNLKVIFLTIFCICFANLSSADSADWNKPTNLSTKGNVLAETRATTQSAACMDYTGDTNLPSLVSGTVGPIRYNRSTNVLQEYLSSTWNDRLITNLKDGAVSSAAKLASDVVTTAKILDGNVTIAKIASAATDGNARADLALISNVQDNTSTFITSGGSANAQTLTLVPAITAYVTGQEFDFIAGYTNTGALTINVNGVSAVNVRKWVDSSIALQGGEVVAGNPYKIIYDGSVFRLISPSAHVIDRVVATTTISNSTTETTLYTFTVPANVLSKFKTLRLTVFGDILNTSAGSTNYTWKVKFGGTTIADTGTISANEVNNNRRLWKIETLIQGLDTSVQRSYTNFELGSTTNNAATLATSGTSLQGGYTDGAANSATSNVLTITGQMGTASVTREMRTLSGILEIL